ncbi:hypothetical protein VaNZ11_006069 [Volvox africanus]|uniref:Uncharacterized protein n=1 Tax=Volvox africanus TaxID=51714 RepID=A0ABQ5S001_9CHLO|nr:hypothetical protein VaNZ11_006069 [Volvox africanus]
MSHVANCGISLNYLLTFARVIPDGYTTADVVQDIVIPATKDRCCRYVSLPAVPQAAVGPAKYFVSHRWAADFTRELVALVAGHFADAGDAAIETGLTAASTKTSVPGGARNSQEAEKRFQATGAATQIGGSADGAAADTSFPRGTGSINLIVRSPTVSSNVAGSSHVIPASTSGYEQQSRAPPPQQQQRQQQQNLHQEQRGSCAQLFRGPSSAGGGFTASRCITATAHSPGSSCLNRSLHPVGAGSTVPGMAGTCRGFASSSSRSSGGQVQGPGTPSGPQFPKSLRVRSSGGSRGNGTGARTTAGVIDGIGSYLSFVGNGRPSTASSNVGPSITEDALRVADPTMISYNFCVSAAAAAATAAAAAVAPTTVVLPGAAIITPRDGSGGGGGDVTGSIAVAATAAAAEGSGSESFGGSLNPLLARPSFVQHPWPNQRFSSMCSRSGCSTSTGGGGGSFTRHGLAAVTQHPSQAMAATAAATGVLGGRHSCGDKVPLTLRGELSTTVTDSCGTAAVEGRSTVTGVLPYRQSPATTPSCSDQHASRRATSANALRRGGSCGAVAAAASSASQASEASDTFAGDTAAAAAGAVSSSSSDRSRSSSSGAGSSRSRGGINAGSGVVDAVLTNADIVDRLLSQFVGREALLRDTYVWLDIFAINQHPSEQQANDLAQLQEVVGASEATLLVMDRYGTVLTRIWCLYEIWQTVRQRGSEAVCVLAGPLDFEELVHVWGDLEVERAQATFSADRDRILADIRTATGSPELNRHIQQALVKSAARDLEAVRAASPRTRLHGERAYRAAVLLRTAGSGAAALAAAREAADVFGSCVGHAHPDTLRALRAVAGCHKDLGAARQAVGLLEQQVIPFLEEAYGFGHTESGALDELGMLYYTLGEYDAAYDMLLAALSRRLRQLQLCAANTVAATQLSAALATGPCASALLAAAAWGCGGGGVDGGIRDFPSLEPLSGEPLAALLAAVTALVSELKVAEAEAAERRAMAEPIPLPTSTPLPPGSSGVGVRKASGAAAGGGGGGNVILRDAIRSSVEVVGLSLHSVGLVQRERAQRCRSAESSPLLQEARELLEASVALLEASSSAARGLSAMDARANLAALAMDGGEYQSAEQLLRQNLTLTERVYGKYHLHTATAANNLAMCLKRQRSASPGKALEAVSLYRRCLDVCSSHHGECHPQTLVVATNLGVLLADQRQWSEAERLLTWAVSSLPPQLGERHPDVLAAYRRLAEVLELRNKLFESEAMFRLTLQLAESGAPEARDHGLVLECREGLQRVQELLEAAARGQAAQGCCVVS